MKSPIGERALRNIPLGLRFKPIMMTLAFVPMFAAAGYSAMYLLGGGGIVGAVVIFFAAKAMGK